LIHLHKHIDMAREVPTSLILQGFSRILNLWLEELSRAALNNLDYTKVAKSTALFAPTEGCSPAKT
jgi:hypothetical protein